MPKTAEPQLVTRPIVTGPLENSRFGKTLVIDLSAPQQGMTVRRDVSIPRASLIVTTVAREVITYAKEGGKLDTIAVVGSESDPSAHPDLREITENVRALRDKHLSRAKLRVFTQARDLASYDLRATLSMYDRVHLQFEWGTAKTFTMLTGEKGTLLTSLVKQAGLFDHLVVEASFVKGPKDNSSDSEVANWIKKLIDVKPQEVHILAGSGSAARIGKAKPVPKSRRNQIADEVAEKTGFNVVVHEGEPALV